MFYKILSLSFIGILLSANSVSAQGFTDQLIIHYKDTASTKRAKSIANQQDKIKILTEKNTKFKSQLSKKAYVVKFDKEMSVEELAEVIKQLETDELIELVEPDYKLELHAVPNDTNYGVQWNLQPTDAYAGSANAEAAWDIEKGDADLVIAVLDTGIIAHEDLVGRFVDGMDMISNLMLANDGDYRDADASDPGNWCGGQKSTWHGTHVAGIIAASTDNAIGVSGINWNSKIQSVRVLGSCGGYSSDLIAGIRWAAGLDVFGSPVNLTPAKIINISAGTKASCTSSLQSAIDDAVSAGAVIVASAGNDNEDASLYTPAGCNNVITVSAVTTNGARGSYSNYGAVVDISAPGGNWSTEILSTLNNGATTPGSDIYGSMWGTSMAAPHVTGAISLMLSVNPNLSVAEIKNIVQSSARAFPAGTGSDCNNTLCGAGIVDIAAAVVASKVNAPPVITIEPDFNADAGNTVQLSATVEDSDGTVVSILWEQTKGVAITITDANQLNASFVAPELEGILEFTLTVIDNEGAQVSATLQVTVMVPIPENINPAVNAGLDATELSGETVYLSGSASDTDGIIQLVKWIQTKGTAVTITNQDVFNTSFIAPAVDEILEFMLTVTDDNGAETSDIVQISVKTPPPVNLSPIVSAGQGYELFTNETGLLIGSASDSDGSISSVNWMQIKGGAVTITSANQLNASFIAPAVDDNLEFMLSVIDDKGAETSSVVKIIVSSPQLINLIPDVNAGADFELGINETGFLSATANDFDGVISSVQWSQIKGVPVVIIDSHKLHAYFISPAMDSILEFELLVKDDSRSVVSDVIVVSIVNNNTKIVDGNQDSTEEGAIDITEEVTLDDNEVESVDSIDENDFNDKEIESSDTAAEEAGKTFAASNSYWLILMFSILVVRRLLGKTVVAGS